MNKLKLAAGAAIALSVSGSALATNGLFSEGWGAKSSSMAGSGSALALDTLVSTTNPAGLVELGKQKDVGLMYFSPVREYTVTGSPGSFPPFPWGSTVESGSESFLVPNFGMNTPLSDRSSWGLSLYGNGGMNTDYPAGKSVIPTPGGPMPVGTLGGGDLLMDYKQLFINASYAHRVSDRVSLGVSGILNYTEFKLKGLSGFSAFSADPSKLSNNGKDNDFGFGALVSMHANLSDSVSLAVGYQSKIENTLDKYSGLFANSGEFTIPARANLGLAFKSDSGSAVTLDIEKIFYEDSDAVSNPSANLFACAGGDTTQCLGGSNGAGFGWNDMTVYKLGLQLAVSDDLVWRFGVSQADGPIDPSDVTINIIAPGVIENHYSTGFTKKLDGGKEFSMSLMYAPEECVNGPSQFNPGQAVEICMKQMALKAQYSW